MSEKRIAAKVENLTKSFRIPLEASSGIKQKIINLLKGKKGYRDFTPLKNVSFEINEGDFFGIVGRNGSGKSTLLKTLAGIYTPDGGAVTVNGKLVPFIELGVGFNPELSGKENVFLNGALLGFSRDEMIAMYEDIVDFAELHDFMEERLKNYSSGMQVRLAFSIAIRAEADVLLLDEVLAVGDEAFQRKCYKYFNSLKEKKKTVILVTHDMGAVERYCNRAIMIEKGEIICSGTNTEVASAYKKLFLDEAIKSEKGVESASRGTVENVNISINSNHNGVIRTGHPIEISLRYDSLMEATKGSIAMSIVNNVGVTVISTGQGMIYDDEYSIKPGSNEITFRIMENQLTGGSYSINVAIAVGPQVGGQELVYQKSAAAGFIIDLTPNQRENAVIQPTIIKTVS